MIMYYYYYLDPPELKEEQSERARLDVPAAARVESCSGPGAAWVSAAASCGADFTELAVGASVEGPEIRWRRWPADP